MAKEFERIVTGDYDMRRDFGWKLGDHNKAYSPEEAKAILARAIENPIEAYISVHFTSYMQGLSFTSHGNQRIEDPGVKDQTAKPDNPGIREATASTYGKYIPVSVGQRRLPGNVIHSTNIEPRLIGNRTYEVTYKVPIFEDYQAAMEIVWPEHDTDIDLYGNLTESSRSVSTKRIENPEDSNQYVDVEVVDRITLTDVLTGRARSYYLKND